VTTARDAAFAKWNPAYQPPAMARLTADQRRRLGELLREWWPYLAAVARGCAGLAYPFGHDADAADLAQEAALRVCRRITGFDPARGEFRFWLRDVVRSTARELRARAFRRKRAAAALGSEFPDGSPREFPDPLGRTPLELLTEEPADPAAASRVRAALGRLPRPQREAVRRRFGIGCPARTVAGIDPLRPWDANRFHLRKGLTALRHQLGA
jgi:RNA polymerase sigma factor (sigma-70 family)